MKDFEEKELTFVAKYYQEGRMDVDKAWKCFSRRTKRRSRMIYHRIAVAAVVLLLVNIAVAALWLGHKGHFTSSAVPEVSPQIVEAESPKDTMRVFHYNHTPIRQVLTELSETYGVELEANDTTQCVTGEFEVSSVEEVISLLENAIPVTITKR